MENFQAGDQVEFMDDNTVGTVVSIIDDKQIIISIDGLEIPVLKSQLIKISKGPQKAKNLAEKYQDELNQETVFATYSNATNKGIFIALSNGEKPEIFHLHLINDTMNDLFFSFYSFFNKELKFIDSGHLKKYDHKALSTYNQLGSSKFPTYTIHILPFNEKAKQIPDMFTHSFTPGGQDLIRKQEKAPLLDFQAWLYEIKKEEEKQVSLTKTVEQETEQVIDVDKPENIIDLHIDKIDPDFNSLDKREILPIQFNYFIKEFEKVIAFNYPSIIIIHGIGVNTLKDKIRKYLMGNKEVINYRDADIREYGYGATEVFLKN
ncbi:MAG: Smr/MutS family protein [Bacteroidetes bacterium]|nr:Smr/MutS family protein [Bacteroidota bacterium]